MNRLARLLRRDRGGPLDCAAVGRHLQTVLDGESGDDIADRVAEHLEDCLACGMEADTYLRIRASLASKDPLDPDAAARLRSFGAALATGSNDDGDPAA